MRAGWRCRAIGARRLSESTRATAWSCDPDGRLYPDLIVAYASQEHGTLAIRSGSSQRAAGAARRRQGPHPAQPRLRDRAQHERYHVVPGPGGAVEAEWPRIRGW